MSIAGAMKALCPGFDAKLYKIFFQLIKSISIMIQKEVTDVSVLW